MQCPRCQTEGSAGEFCPGCGQRLFAWLGDPFGSLELSPTAAATRTQPLPRAHPSVQKLIMGIAVVFAAWFASPVVAGVALVTMLVVLWRWPRLGWLPW